MANDLAVIEGDQGNRNIPVAAELLNKVRFARRRKGRQMD
jgi:hypothetical protein